MGQPSVKKNFILNTMLSLSSIIFPILTNPYINRVLGPAGTGRVGFASSAVNYFALFASLGIPTYGIRACAKVRDNKALLSKTVLELQAINLILTFVVYIVFIPAVFLIPQFSCDKALMFILGSTILLSSIGVEFFYKAIEQYRYITVRSLIFKFIAFIAMYLLVRTENDVVIYGAITIFAASASNIMNFVHLRKMIVFKGLGKLNLKQHIGPTITFFAFACTISIYLNLDRFMLGVMTTRTDVGYYESATKIKSVLVALVTSLGAVLYPRVSYYVENKLYDEFYRITAKALRFVFVISVPLFVFFTYFAFESIMVASGLQFEASVHPMMVIMPTLVLIGITNIIGFQILLPLGKEKLVVCSTAVGAVVDLILNFLLIPEYKALGAAIGTLAAEFAVLVVQLIFLVKLKNEVPIIQSFKQVHYVKITLATLAGLAVSFGIKLFDLNIPFLEGKILLYNLTKLAIASVLFFGVYGILMIIFKDEIILEVINLVLKKLHLKKETSN
ncbi:MAG: flippase [Clostridiales bacterium]|nr:flippase [Clostridiales bacterium]